MHTQIVLKTIYMKMNKRSTSLMAAIAISACITVVPAKAQTSPKLSDPEIASVAVVANQVDINAGQLAKTKSKDKEVLNFANTMINDHKSVIQQASALVQKLKVTPKDNAVSKKLNADAQKTMKSLKAKSGKAFEKAYIDNEVAYHKAVISTVEGVLIPESQNQELKQLLQNVLPALRTHLEHAQMVQKNFK
jgi:putative membrane protein